MECPACGHAMREVEAGNVKVDACQSGCGGLWFDRMELKKLDEKREKDGEPLLSFNKGQSVIKKERRRCPRCNPHHVLQTKLYHPTILVQIEECPGCGGHFLDPGELAQIRGQAQSDAMRKSAAERIYQQRMVVPATMERIERQRQEAEANSVVNLLQWIFPWM